MRRKVKGSTKAYREQRIKNIEILATREGCSWTLCTKKNFPKTIKLLGALDCKYEKLSELYGEDRVLKAHIVERPNDWQMWRRFAESQY